MIIDFFAIAVLIIASYFDIRKRIIPNITVIALFALGIVNIFLNSFYFDLIIGIIFPSIILLLLKIILKQNIGFGDIKMLSALGFLIGYKQTFILLFISLAVCLIFSVISKKKTKETIPFAPFFLIGYVFQLIFF